MWGPNLPKMSTTEGKDISDQPSEILKVFRGKSVFITGAAGFLGVVSDIYIIFAHIEFIEFCLEN